MCCLYLIVKPSWTSSSAFYFFVDWNRCHLCSLPMSLSNFSLFNISSLESSKVKRLFDPHSSCVKKTNVATSIAHLWKENTIVDCLKVQTMNVTPVEAELMAIRIGLTSAIENNDTCSIIVITDSLSAAQKILDSHVHLYQSAIIPIASKIKSYLNKGCCNSIHSWYCPSKAKWPK